MLKFLFKLCTLALFVTLHAPIAVKGNSPIVFCYYGSWSHYRNSNGQFAITDLDTDLCTHVAYAFFGITTDGAIKYLDSWLDIDLGNIQATIALKQRNPKLKILAAVGGWNEGSTTYSNMAADAGKRATFIQSAVDMLNLHGFDGLDLDWEYPAQRGGSIADRLNFVTLLKELKSSLSSNGLLLTVAVAAAAPSASISYDIPGIMQYVNYVNLMTYDFASAYDAVLGYNAPLLGAGPNTVNAAVEYWLQQGATASKLLLGIPFYGRTFTLADTSQNLVGAPSTGPGLAGPYTLESGFLGYNEICERIGSWTQLWDDKSLVPYAYTGNQWISYDNEQSLLLKMDYLKGKNLGGAMVWSIETDDFLGVCGPETFPLLRSINNGLNNVVVDTHTSTTARSSVTTARTTSKTITNTPSGNNGCTTDGTFVNPRDCTRFFKCINGLRYDFACPAGLNFDHTIGNCNWPALVECNNI